MSASLPLFDQVFSGPPDPPVFHDLEAGARKGNPLNLFNIKPGFATKDILNCGAGNLVLKSQPSSANSAKTIPFPNHDHFVLRELGIAIVFAANVIGLSIPFMGRACSLKPQSERVFNVFGTGNPFEIAQSVVCFYPIFMVHLMARRRRQMKAQKNETMKPQVSSRLSAEINVAITSYSNSRAERRLTRAAGHDSSDSSQRGYEVFVKLKRWSPLFGFEFFGGKFFNRHGMNLTNRFVSSLGSFGVQPSFEPFAF